MVDPLHRRKRAKLLPRQVCSWPITSFRGCTEAFGVGAKWTSLIIYKYAPQLIGNRNLNCDCGQYT